MSRKKKTNINPMIISVIIAVMLLIIRYFQSQETAGTYNPDPIRDLRVHFIDVSQGDCILIQTPEAAMLIDAGERSEGKNVASYIEELGIKKLDYVVGTHPHSDHIGGLAHIVNTFGVENIIMPRLQKTPTTQDYENLLNAVSAKSLKIKSPEPGAQFYLGDVLFTVLSPGRYDYEDLNDYSYVLKAEYGETSFVFTGDATELVENEMLESGLDISADVLKVGHHGSNTSTSADFLDSVNPYIAVIQSGRDNSYGHPHDEVVKRLEEKLTFIYRNDTEGDIVLASDGEKLYTVK